MHYFAQGQVWQGGDIQAGRCIVNENSTHKASFDILQTFAFILSTIISYFHKYLGLPNVAITTSQEILPFS